MHGFRIHFAILGHNLWKSKVMLHPKQQPINLIVSGFPSRLELLNGKNDLFELYFQQGSSRRTWTTWKGASGSKLHKYGKLPCLST